MASVTLHIKARLFMVHNWTSN